MADTTHDAIPNYPTYPQTRPSILRSRSASDVSTISSDSKSSITFAPLPEIDRRKRRTHRPIGLANRAEMIRRSQQSFSHSSFEDDDSGPPPEDDDEIPLPDLGKLMKGLWRSVSRGHGKDKNLRKTQEEYVIGPVINEEDGEGRVWEEVICMTPHLGPREGSNGEVICNGTILDEFDVKKSEIPPKKQGLGDAREGRT